MRSPLIAIAALILSTSQAIAANCGSTFEAGSAKYEKGRSDFADAKRYLLYIADNDGKLTKEQHCEGNRAADKKLRSAQRYYYESTQYFVDAMGYCSGHNERKARDNFNIANEKHNEMRKFQDLISDALYLACR